MLQAPVQKRGVENAGESVGGPRVDAVAVEGAAQQRVHTKTEPHRREERAQEGGVKFERASNCHGVGT